MPVFEALGNKMQFIAFGRLHPERAAAYFDEVKLNFGELGYLRVKCDAGQLSAIFDWGGNDVVGAKLTIEHHAQAIASALGFSLNCGYSIEIISVQKVGDLNGPYTFGVKGPNEVPENQIEIFNEALHFSTKNVYFRLALRDYMRALVDQHDCAFYCYRAIEAVTKSFAASSGGAGWQEMHASLGTSKEEITQKIKVYADPVRHGNWVEAKGLNNQNRLEMLDCTHRLLLAFLKHGA